jgi:3-hydroxybutyryl-CoA dehydratase
MNLAVGRIYIYYKEFTNNDVRKYAELTGDFNPIHFDEEYTKNTQFKKPIIHGPLLLTYITTLFAKDVPGPGSVYLGHELKFLSPVFPNEIIKVQLEVIEINKKNHIFLKTTCFNQNDIKVLEGVARLKLY